MTVACWWTCTIKFAHTSDCVASADEEEYHDILTMPESVGGKIFFLYCFPMLVVFKFTILDVRKKKWTSFYPVTMATTVVWLAFMAEGMMAGAETAGCIMEIPEDVMGLTVAAAGTSLPNLFASLIVAKQGLGNMSVSNAFGSNTFNIFIALAVSDFHRIRSIVAACYFQSVQLISIVPVPVRPWPSCHGQLVRSCKAHRVIRAAWVTRILYLRGKSSRRA